MPQKPVAKREQAAPTLSPEALFGYYKECVHGKDGKHELAMHALRTAAEAGYARAQYEQSEWCQGEEKMAWLVLAAEAGSIQAIHSLETLAGKSPEGRFNGRTVADWRRMGIEHALHGRDPSGIRFMGGILRAEAGRDPALLAQALDVFEHGVDLGDEECRNSAIALRRALRILESGLAALVRELGPGVGFHGEVLDAIVALIRPSKRGIAQPTAAVRSRLGGRPILPPGTAWPMDGRAPLSFIAGIDLAEAGLSAIAPGVPATGRLLFFADDQGFFKVPSEPVGCRVLYFPDAGGVEAVAPKGAMTFGSVPLAFVDEETLPYGRTALARDATGSLHKSYWDLWDAWHEARTPAFRDGHVHRLLGHADAIQGDMARILVYEQAGRDVDEPSPELDAAAARMRLLLQVDSESNADMMWGDLGRIYFLIDVDDLAKGNFTRVSVVLQCG